MIKSQNKLKYQTSTQKQKSKIKKKTQHDHQDLEAESWGFDKHKYFEEDKLSSSHMAL